MARTTDADLDDKVNVINKLTGNTHHFELGRAYGGYRLHRNNGSVDVSPRLPAGQMDQWLEAYILGLMFADARKAH